MTTRKETAIRNAFKTLSEALNTDHMAEIWNTLSKVDVGPHIKTAEVKKDGLVVYQYQYLPWSWAWSTFMSHFPDSSFKVLDEDILENRTVMVNVSVHVVHAGVTIERPMFLPVMDQRNNAIENPTTRQINDARMRCIVKGLAMNFGLGLDLWTGSDYPVGVAADPLTEDQLVLIKGLFDKLAEQSQKAFMVWADTKTLGLIPQSKYQSTRKFLEAKLKAQSTEQRK